MSGNANLDELTICLSQVGLAPMLIWGSSNKPFDERTIIV